MASANFSPVVRHIRHLIGDGLGGLSDGQLLDRFVVDRDESAFAQLVRRHGSLVLGACRRVLGDAHAAEDVFQATFLVLVRKADSLDRRRPLGNWLYTVAYRLALTARANSSRRRTYESRAAQGRPATAESDRTEELKAVLEEELHRLPERHRAPLVLCYLEGKTNEQAAQALGWPRGSISRRLAEARDVLRERLRGRGYVCPTAGMAALLAGVAKTEAVTLPLLDTTVQAALWFAGEGAATGGVLSVQAVTLAKGVLHTMALQKLKLAAAAVLVAGLLGGGGTMFVQSVVGAPAVEAASAPVAVAEDQPAAASVSPAARLGTTQLRHGDTIHFIAYTHNGRWLVTAGKDQTIRLWDAATNEELRRFERPASEQGKGGGTDGQEKEMMARGFIPAMGGLGQDLARSFRVALAPDGKHLAATKGNAVHVWDVASGKLVHTFRENGPAAVEQLPLSGVADLTFTIDGKSLVTVTGTRVVTEWDLATGKHTRRLGQDEAAAPGDGSRVVVSTKRVGGGLALAPGGRYLAWEHYDTDNQAATLKVLDLTTGKEVAECKLGVDGAKAMTFAPDGKTMAWTSFRTGIQVWDGTAGKEPRRLGAGDHRGPEVETLAFSPNGKLLAASRSDRTAQVWDTVEGKMLNQVGESPEQPQFGARVIVRMAGTGSAANPVEVAFAPDGQTLATSLGGVAVRRFDVASGKETASPGAGHTGPVTALRLSPDGKTLVTHAKNDAVRVWDLAQGREVRQIRLPAGAVGVTLTADGRHVAALTGSSVTYWDVATGQEAGKVETGGQGMTTLALSPDGKTVATRGQTGPDVYVWDRATGRQMHTLTGTTLDNPGNAAGVTVTSVTGVLSSDLVYSPDGRYLAGAGPKRQLCLWDVASGHLVWEQEMSGDQTLDRFAFTGNGLALAGVKRDGTVTLYETATGEVRGQFGQPSKGRTSSSMAVMIGGAPVMVAGGQREAITPAAVASSPGSRFLAVASGDPVLHLWDVVTGKEVCQFKGHQGGITSLGFSADGQRVVSGSLDTTALVWDLGERLDATASTTTEPAPKELDGLWSDLGGKDAAKAFAAQRRLSQQPTLAAGLIRSRLRPATAVDAARMRQLVADLDSRDFAVRQKATAELEQFGDQARSELEKALAGDVSLEVRQRVERLLKKTTGNTGTDLVRELRAVEILELAGGPEATEVLKALAQGAPQARLTREAKAALERLALRRLVTP